MLLMLEMKEEEEGNDWSHSCYKYPSLVSCEQQEDLSRDQRKTGQCVRAWKGAKELSLQRLVNSGENMGKAPNLQNETRQLLVCQSQ